VLPGLPHEPTVADSLRAGVDLVTYSGDKLLGGPQAGLISGRAALLARLRANPLFRALRVDRLVLAALEATLALYARQAWDELPLAAMAAVSPAALEARVRGLASQLPASLDAKVVSGRAPVGGGAAPGQALATWLISLPEPFAAALRQAQPPVVARLARNRCLLDLRTVFPAQESSLLAALRALA
ncbi:MAG: hypothetical protein ACRD1E_03740, partial [Terriglobales bacterium]